MRRILKWCRAHKLDEMEQFILFRAQRNAYLFLVLALAVWSLYESCRVYLYHSQLNPLPCLLLGGTMAVQVLSQLLLTRSAVKDDEDSYETGPLMKLVLLACVLVCVIATLAASFLLMGVAL